MKYFASLFCLALALVTFAPTASAQETDFTLNRFHAAETPDDSFAISEPLTTGHLRFGGQLHLEYANDPLIREENEEQTSVIVGDQVALHLNLALNLFDRLTLAVGLPINLYMGGGNDNSQIQGSAGLGDLSLAARVRLYGDASSIFAIALQLTGTFPTAQSSLRGDSFLSIHPEILFAFHASPVRVTVNAGGRVRDNQELGRRTVGDELTYGLGVAFGLIGDYERPWETRLDLVVQGFGDTSFQHLFERQSTSLEALLGLKLHHSSGLTTGLAGTVGLNPGVGTPDFRFIFNLGWAMPVEGEEPAPEPTDDDRDGDGILNEQDQCPDEAEDFDDFEDLDGCPDLDNDQDGIADRLDQCPLEPEDRDGWEDSDGCPDPNNDGDPFPDVADECPDRPEDVDTYEDADGCPDPDNDSDGVLDVDDECPLIYGVPQARGCPADRDGDGVLDHLDNCPDEPGPPENQGCQREQQVRLQEGRLEILDKVYFRTNSHVILRRSYPLLNNVAQVLDNHPEIELVRVEGHTDSRGNDEMNLNLSQRRADSVVDYLIRRGIDDARLTGIGYGETRPIADESTREGQAANRRVEFNLGELDAPIEQGNSGPSEDSMD